MRFVAELWRHSGENAWHFVTVARGVSEEIRDRATGLHKPFGSFPVQARIGGVAWRTCPEPRAASR